MSHPTIATATVAACFSVTAQSLIQQLVAQGTRIVGFGRPGDEARARELESRYPDQVQVLLGDLTDQAQCQQLVNQAERHLGGRIDAHYHCCGVYSWNTWQQVSADEVARLHQANFTTAWTLARPLLASMKRGGGGNLMFISARDTRRSIGAGFGPYMASKLALNGLVESLAAEAGADGIQVNAVLPTIIDTQVNRAAMPQVDPAEWIAPDQLASLMIDLTRPGRPNLTGALIPVNGAMM
ncbi:NAD(P)-dependent dehydrogenase, short-chain alcohol dehydrogenase family [Ferrimonas sediminum]|uniref:NAD(P)-dependent dehydrogenase, short-chain alcohol dehydrogenase family n=1 Tax=Ferrimonas sediminum TaxID=718193 RepID=A0A1G8W5X4_9GAMM|nr:SDR family NAD(P)-dependent oxidoreductase [Ferrimonas sediminum]SDJ73523.1 NAD(P)-dependent dehydrogenase, short-chain alcohol dehydrogenase family [Ferrimonas sediminum]